MAACTGAGGLGRFVARWLQGFLIEPYGGGVVHRGWQDRGVPNFDQFPAGQRDQEAIRLLLDHLHSSLPQSASGLVGETMDRRLLTTTYTPVSQRLLLVPIYFWAGDRITGLWAHVQTGASTVTLIKQGIYSRTGSQLASTANNTSVYNSPGLATMALTSPFDITVSDIYYLAMLQVATTPAIMSGVNTPQSTLLLPIGQGITLAARVDSQSDLPATASLATANQSAPWMAAN